jgi:hypothetical protein
LSEAGRLLADPFWQGEAERVGSALLETIRGHGRMCANPVGMESPGLMTGLAGVGYGLLRLAEPEHVPCLLRLAPLGITPSVERPAFCEWVNGAIGTGGWTHARTYGHA